MPPPVNRELHDVGGAPIMAPGAAPGYCVDWQRRAASPMPGPLPRLAEAAAAMRSALNPAMTGAS